MLQETLRLGDISLNVVDTAGIRETEDTVEKIGVKKAYEYAREAELIVYVADASMELDENDREIVSFIGDKNVIVLLNKSDLANVVTEEDIKELFRNSENTSNEESLNVEYRNKLAASMEDDREKIGFHIVRTSVLEGEGMEALDRKSVV